MPAITFSFDKGLLTLSPAGPGLTGSSGTGAQQVNRANGVTTLAVASSAYFGQAVALTGHAHATAPAGRVEFDSGGAVLGFAALDASGSATLAVSSLGVGHDPVVAYYLGSDAFAAGDNSAAPFDQVVRDGVAVDLRPDATATVYGQVLTLTAAVSSADGWAGTPTGRVTFYDNGGLLGSAPLDDGGTASWAVGTLEVGGHDLTASYTGDDSFADAASACGSVSDVVGRDGTSTVLSADASPALYGRRVTFTAQVFPDAPADAALVTPGGCVTLTIDGLPYPGRLDSTGTAAFPTDGLGLGSHAVTVAYLGDDHFLPSDTADAPLAESVRDGTTVGLSADAASAFGQPLTVTATVAPADSWAGTPTGSVQFYDDGVYLDSSGLDADGHATLTTAGLGLGDHRLTAYYAGDGSFADGGSGACGPVVSVGRATTTTTLTDGGTGRSVTGRTVTFTATVAAAPPSDPAAVTPAGSVTFRIDGMVVDDVALAADGTASYTTDALAAGGHGVTASYDGGDAFAASDSGGPFVETVDLPARIAGSVWEDADGDGRQRDTEPGGAGLTVSLLDANGYAVIDAAGDPVGDAITAADGTYAFAGLAAGDYLVQFNAPDGAELEGGGQLAVTAAAGGTATADEGYFYAAALGGTVWSDTTGVGLADVGVELVDGNGAADVINASGMAVGPAQTGSDGTYSFDDLMPGTYRVRFEAPAGYVMDGSNQPVWTGCTAVPGGSFDTYAGQLGTVSGTVRDDALDGIAGVAVTLTDVGGTVQTAVTLDGGGYEFVDVAPGGYTLAFAASDGHLFERTGNGTLSLGDTLVSGGDNTGDDATAFLPGSGSSSVSLSAEADPVLYGRSVTLTATVSGASPSGWISFYDGGSLLGSGRLDGDGIATLAVSSLTVGDHPDVTAVYGGDRRNGACENTSEPLDEDVQDWSSTSLTTSENTVPFGQTVTFTATVSPGDAWAGTPTGTVVFTVDGIAEDPVTLDDLGTATYSTASLAVGVHTVAAAYGGDNNVAQSDSMPASLAQTVQPYVLPPQVYAGGDQTVGIGGSVQFHGTAVSEVGITSVAWDFDYDGTTFVADPSATSLNASHLFDEPGIYIVALQATDTTGLTGLAFASVTVAEADPQPAKGQVTTVVLSGPDGQQIY